MSRFEAVASCVCLPVSLCGRRSSGRHTSPKPYPTAEFAAWFLCAEKIRIFDFFYFEKIHISLNIRTVLTWFEQFAACLFSRITDSHSVPSVSDCDYTRAAVGMGIPMGIPMGMGMVWVWGLWWIPMGSVGNLWAFLNGCNFCGIETNSTNSEFIFS